MAPRVAVVGLWHETNTYSARSADLPAFSAFELLAGPEIVERNAGTGSVIGGFLDADGLDLSPVMSAGAWPCGPADEGTFATLLERLTDALRTAGHVDGVLVNLHGAMVAEQTPDAEAVVLDTIRNVVGGVPIAGVLDLHANPSPQLADACDILLSYDTYPHIDMRERGREAAVLLQSALAGTPMRTALGKLPLLVCPLAQGTDDEPMRSLQARATARGHEAGLARVCVVGGFAYSDVERAGMSVLAVHHLSDDDAARDVVRETLEDIQSHAGAFAVVRDDPATAVSLAIASDVAPVILADVGDNVGGGSPGDGTALLAELLDQGAQGAVVTIADAEMARNATRAGVGSNVVGDLGGKTDAHHGPPLPIRGRVVALSDGSYRTAGSWMTGRSFSMGQTAVIDLEGVTVVVTEHPTPPFHLEQLTSVGVDPERCSIIVAKGALAWRAALGDVARDVIEVATPGICPVDPAALPRKSEPMSLAP